MLQQIPIPYGISWERFVSTLIGFNPSLNQTLSPQGAWREVAQRIGQSAPNAPRPESFKDWRDWAVALKQAYPH